MNNAIPKKTAISICQQIQVENTKPRLSLAGLQCWVCAKCTQGDPATKLFACREGNRGCNLVNKVYDTLKTTKE